MKTVRRWPSRHTRAMACRSFAGFQSMSKSTRRDAPTMLSPTPPALELSRNTVSGPKRLLKRSTSATRFAVGR